MIGIRYCIIQRFLLGGASVERNPMEESLCYSYSLSLSKSFELIEFGSNVLPQKVKIKIEKEMLALRQIRAAGTGSFLL